MPAGFPPAERHEKGEKTENGRIASLECVSIHLRFVTIIISKFAVDFNSCVFFKSSKK